MAEETKRPEVNEEENFISECDKFRDYTPEELKSCTYADMVSDTESRPINS